MTVKSKRRGERAQPPPVYKTYKILLARFAARSMSAILGGLYVECLWQLRAVPTPTTGNLTRGRVAPCVHSGQLSDKFEAFRV